jgi:ABC-type sugar transport system ATPase subunit
LGLPFVDRQRMRHEAAETLKTLDIELDRLDRPVRALSGERRTAESKPDEIVGLMVGA